MLFLQSQSYLSFFWLILFMHRKFIYLILAFTLVMFLLPGILVFPYFSYMMGYGEILIAVIVVSLIGFFQVLSTSLTSPVQETNSPA